MDDFETAIAEYYRLGPERDRLSTWGYLEALRTAELLGRHLPPAPGIVYDIGGAEGAYALPLARDGYEVHLVDAWAPHVTAAAEASAAQPAAPLAGCTVGDARDLPFDDGTADAVLLLGPLYHLLERSDRLRALREAHRVLKPGGVLFAAAVSRYASTFDGVAMGDIVNPDFQELVQGALRDGLHRNTRPDEFPQWFTLTYFHRPADLRDEVADAGFRAIELVAVESVAAWAADSRRLSEPEYRDATLKAIHRVESVPELLGASPHLMAVARRSH
ncbi:SAM-dependent methyltransferase [Saccharopolyspora karakumensis]|uniref:SAM-dependent methyltransferase n=1 Tax=Saccharopolyspora karakumensis TaxID=2530386 RepID=A0A4R5BY54_9PSEU|nr:class I SAM-dependent methyltransferase [Saccharopolyspora karakumensis]TDD90330.1 SAM-dependent methyltransferase [Saccharopolyspora karakumensis]